MSDNFLLGLVIVAAVLVGINDARSCGRFKVTCDQGQYICTRRFLGGEKVYKETDTKWWIWPDCFGPNQMIIVTNPKIEKL